MEILNQLKFYLLAFLLMIPFFSTGQKMTLEGSSKIYENDRNIYFELAGSGGLGSFNYESKINKLEKFNLRFRVGLSYGPIDRNNGGVIVVPLMIHSLIGKKQHLLDIGIGQSISFTTKGNFFFLMPLSLGYRWDNNTKRCFWRFSYTPIVSYLLDFQWQHWGGITFGIKLD
jgi:hypothetical protein